MSEKVRLGNALAHATVVVASAQARTGRFVQFEHASRLLMMAYAPLVAMMKEFGFVVHQGDAGADGPPWRKPLLIVTPCEAVGNSIRSLYPGEHSHITRRGLAPEGIPWTRVADPYLPEWSRAVAEAWGPILRQEPHRQSSAGEDRARSSTAQPSDQHSTGHKSLLLQSSAAIDESVAEAAF